jgi:hypothetical protein
MFLLRDVLQRKLREARYFSGKINAVAQRAVGDPEEFGFLLSAWLSACRSITAPLENRRYGKWFETWRADRTVHEQELFDFMATQRIAEVHRDGADVRRSVQWIPISAIREGHPGYNFASWALGTEPPKIGVNICEFEFGRTGLEASRSCSDFVVLLEHLLTAFEKAYPGD